MIKINKNNFPSELHACLGLATTIKETFDIPKGVTGLLFAHGQFNGKVMPRNDRYYFVTNDGAFIVESYNKEIFDRFRVDANTALKRLQDAKNRRQRLVEAQKRGFHTADEAWSLVGEVLNIERLQKDFNEAIR